MLSEGLKMKSVGLDLCLGAGQSLKQEYIFSYLIQHIVCCKSTAGAIHNKPESTQRKH